jgi:hypothetical protein
MPVDGGTCEDAYGKRDEDNSHGFLFGGGWLAILLALVIASAVRVAFLTLHLRGLGRFMFIIGGHLHLGVTHYILTHLVHLGLIGFHFGFGLGVS